MKPISEKEIREGQPLSITKLLILFGIVLVISNLATFLLSRKIYLWEVEKFEYSQQFPDATIIPSSLN